VSFVLLILIEILLRLAHRGVFAVSKNLGLFTLNKDASIPVNRVLESINAIT
jgi:hypothetical protein